MKTGKKNGVKNSQKKADILCVFMSFLLLYIGKEAALLNRENIHVKLLIYHVHYLR